MTEKREARSVPTLDLQRYLGLWFEIGRLPLRYEDDGARDVTAGYSLNEDGTVSKVVIEAGLSEADQLAAAKSSAKIQEQIAGKTIVKEISVPGRLVNIVVR